MKILWDRDNPDPESLGVIVPVVITGEKKRWQFDPVGCLQRESSDDSTGPRFSLSRIEQEGNEIILRFVSTNEENRDAITLV